MTKINKTVLNLDNEEQKLLLQLEAIKTQRADAQRANDEATAQKVHGLTKLFGVSTLAEVISLVKKVEKGIVGNVDASASTRSYVRLSDEQKVAVATRLANGEQVSAIAKEMGINAPVVYALKRKASEASATSAAETVAAS